MTKLAIVGAGLAGLTLANSLSKKAQVTVFEKSHGFGGRMATRRLPPYEFDHGTQFFTARSRDFKEVVRSWRAQGVINTWQARFAELDRDRIMAISQWGDDDGHYVGTPGMNQIGRYLAEGLDVRLGIEVRQIREKPKGWQLVTANGNSLGTFDWVIATAPGPQTARLMPECFPHIEQVLGARMQACFALMLGYRQHPNFDWQAALVRNADISWIAVNSSKPSRPGSFTLVAHATSVFSDDWLESDPDEVAAHLARELQTITGVDPAEAEIRSMQRWRYADIAAPCGEPALIDLDQRLAACGDWCIRGRVEAAFTSATALAKLLDPVI